MNKEALNDNEVLKTVINPYGLNPIGEQDGPDNYDLRKVIYDKTKGFGHCRPTFHFSSFSKLKGSPHFF